MNDKQTVHVTVEKKPRGCATFFWLFLFVAGLFALWHSVPWLVIAVGVLGALVTVFYVLGRVKLKGKKNGGLVQPGSGGREAGGGEPEEDRRDDGGPDDV